VADITGRRRSQVGGTGWFSEGADGRLRGGFLVGNRQSVHANTFCLDSPNGGPDIVGVMKTTTMRRCWRTDLAEFRGLTNQERTGFLLVLEWFENFRLRHQLEAGVEAARAFWRTDVLREGVTREAWSRKRLRLTRSLSCGN
jgi:hypothetical protein